MLKLSSERHLGKNRNTTPTILDGFMKLSIILKERKGFQDILKNLTPLKKFLKE